MNRLRRASLATALALLAALAGCESIPLPENPFGGSLSIEREREMTAEIAAQIRTQAPFVTDPELLSYVNDIGQRLVSTTEPQPFIYRFSIIDDDSLNAFTIGGGHVYINSGVIAEAGSLSELVGVLAHEVAHVRRRHVAKRGEGQSLATIATLATLAAVALAGGDPGLIAITQGINVALQLKHSRRAEAEADREAIDYMIRAGYHPEGLVRFFERISLASPRPGANIPAYLYSHPDVRERISVTRSMLERLNPPEDLLRDDAVPHARPGEDAVPTSPHATLAAMQARLALLSQPIVGGSGLQARAHFDRSLNEELLEQARTRLENDDPDAAHSSLLEATLREPTDPRPWLALAELAESRDDLDAAVLALERAITLDPSVPLVQYQLGRAHQKLGNRSRAVFYLEQAARNFSPGSSVHRKVEFAIDRISISVLESAGLHTARSDDERDAFARGEEIVWWGQLHRGFLVHNPEFEVTWTGPDGEPAFEETFRLGLSARIESRLETTLAAPGAWSVRVSVEDTRIDDREFTLSAP